MEIKELRERIGMSVREFATYLDIPVDSIRNWERGHRSPPPYLVKLVKRVLIADGRLEQ